MRDARFVRKNFRYVALLVAALMAVVTPTPSARTMLAFMFAMIALYLAGEFVTNYRRAKHSD